MSLHNCWCCVFVHLQESQESLAKSTDHQLTEQMNACSLTGKEYVASSLSATVISRQSEQQQDSAAAVLVKLMPECCTSSDDDEVAAINNGCEGPPPVICSRRSVFTDSNSNGHDSPTDVLDLEMIEQN